MEDKSISVEEVAELRTKVMYHVYTIRQIVKTLKYSADKSKDGICTIDLWDIDDISQAVENIKKYLSRY